MSTVYSPTPAVLTDITLPDDGDPVVAAAQNAPVEAIADAVAFVQTAMKLRSQAFTSDGSFTVPANVALLQGIGWGSGGAAAPGQDGVHGVLDIKAPGGGGGAGAPLTELVIAVTPGETLDVFIGAAPTASQDGNPTLIKRSGATIATFPGGSRGHKGPTFEQDIADAARTPWSAPGQGAASGDTDLLIVGRVELAGIDAPPGGLGAGGWGSSVNGQKGRASTTGFAGGARGTPGSTGGGGQRGGGGGGGGGAGPGGVGGAAGNGGNGNASGAGGNGSAGSNAAAGTGAGGGAGGGGAQGTTADGTGGLGGLGGSGKLTLFWTAVA